MCGVFTLYHNLTPVKQQILHTFRMLCTQIFTYNNKQYPLYLNYFIMACAYILVNIDNIVVSGAYVLKLM